MKRTDIILAVGTLALVPFAGAVLSATGTLDRFLSWAWERHHNVLSWYIRPLFLLPLAYFSYRRSLSGIALTLVALATGMFWFPAPERVDPRVKEFLAFEREWLTGEWTTEKIVSALAVPLIVGMLCLAFWKRSFTWGLIIINAIAVTIDGVGRHRRRGQRLGDARARPRGTSDLQRGSARRHQQVTRQVFAPVSQTRAGPVGINPHYRADKRLRTRLNGERRWVDPRSARRSSTARSRRPGQQAPAAVNNEPESR
jgi:hypothetical protein